MSFVNEGSKSDGGPLSQGHGSNYRAHDLVMKFTISMALKAALELEVPDILDKSEGGKPLTADDILAQLPVKSGRPSSESVRRLNCVLKLLVWEGFITESFNGSEGPAYGLTELSRFFVKENKVNLLPLTDFAFRDEALIPFGRLSKAVLDDSINPVEDYLGMPGYEYTRRNPDFGRSFQGVMIALSNTEAPNLMRSLQRSGALEGVHTLVDVGGGTGSNVAHIISTIPHIQGINYDHPNVIAQAPAVKGLTHVGGSILESVPSGDAMFVKWVLHSYNDENATRILKNCFEALPKQGKVIIVEYILLDDNVRNFKARIGVVFNIAMLTFMAGAQERTAAHYKKIIAAAGFSRTEFIQSPDTIDLIIAYKE